MRMNVPSWSVANLSMEDTLLGKVPLHISALLIIPIIHKVTHLGTLGE
jgi:hypothetical protein